jgi:hypothetical protein
MFIMAQHIIVLLYIFSLCFCLFFSHFSFICFCHLVFLFSAILFSFGFYQFILLSFVPLRFPCLLSICYSLLSSVFFGFCVAVSVFDFLCFFLFVFLRLSCFLLLFCFRFCFLILFSFYPRLWLLPCRSNNFVDPNRRASFHLFNSWHKSMFEILTSHDHENASPAMTTTLSRSETE